MDVADDRITFWFGCNMLRHAEMIRLSIMLLERAGYDVNAAGGPAYCCGTAHDHQPRGASNMAGRTVGRFNEAAEKEGRGNGRDLVPVLSHAHVRHHGARQCHGVRHRPYHRAAGRSSRSAGAAVTRSSQAARASAPASGICHARAGQRSRGELAFAHSRPGADRRARPSRTHVQRIGCRFRVRWQGCIERDVGGGGCTPGRHGLHDLPSLPSRIRSLDGREGIGVRNWVQLVAEAMGIEASDAYVGWRKGGAPDIAAIERADPAKYQVLVETELRRPAPPPKVAIE